MILILFSMITSIPSWAGPRYERAKQEHEEAKRQLEEAQQRVFDKLNNIYTVSKTPDASPQKIKDAENAFHEAQKEVTAITDKGFERLNSLLEVLVYRGSTGTIIEVDPSRRDADGFPLRDDAGGKAAPESVIGGGSASGKDDVLSSALPTSVPTAAPTAVNEIVDPTSPRQEVFKKRGYLGPIRVVPAPDPVPAPKPQSKSTP